MSKVKEALLKSNEAMLEFEIGYQEYLMENIQEPTTEELDAMEQEFNISNPLNNQTYKTKGEHYENNPIQI